MVTAVDRMAGGFIIVPEADRSKYYYLTTIMAPDKLPPLLMPNNYAHYGLL